MNAALLKVSLGVIARHFFKDEVTVKAAFLDSDDTRYGTITLLIEGDDLPAAPEPGEKYAVVQAIFTVHRDEQNLVPAESITVSFDRVKP